MEKMFGMSLCDWRLSTAPSNLPGAYIRCSRAKGMTKNLRTLRWGIIIPQLQGEGVDEWCQECG